MRVTEISGQVAALEALLDSGERGPTDQIIGSGPVGEGALTVPEDRLNLRPILMTALKRKLLWLRKAEDLPGFLFWL